MPPLPKHPSVRARRNRTSTNATLTVVENPKVPPLPRDHDWRKETRRWWKDAWSSPMSAEFDDSDLHVLLRLAMLVDAYYIACGLVNVDKMVKLASEIRLQEKRFGLTPMDRRTLQWTIEQGEKAAQATEGRRRSHRAQQVGPASGVDPRQALA